MTRIEGVCFCDGCGAEITWSPVIIQPPSSAGHARPSEFCCHDCADGRPCRCGERQEFDDETREHGKISPPY